MLLTGYIIVNETFVIKIVLVFLIFPFLVAFFAVQFFIQMGIHQILIFKTGEKNVIYIDSIRPLFICENNRKRYFFGMVKFS